MSRAAIFIDGAYVDFGLRGEFRGIRIDYGKFADVLAGPKEILRTYYYHCLPYKSNPPTLDESDRFGKKQAFMSALDRLPRFCVRYGKLAYRGETAEGTPIFQQKRVDIMLGVDMVQLSTKRQIDTLILVAGDSDFLPAVQTAKDEGVMARLFYFQTSRPHADLWEACDERIVIDQTVIDSARQDAAR